MNRRYRVIIITIIALFVFTLNSFAVNTTAVNKIDSTIKQTAKSNNANLANLGITPNDFSGFKESKTEYEVSVPNNVTEVEVYATKKDAKATLAGTGKVKLVEGKNKAEVTVTAEDGTKKTYTININRLKVGEKDTTSTKSDIALESLEIKGCNLEPQFSQSTYQYTVNYEGSENTLEIVAKANKTDASVKILGDEKLINGKNLVTIMVTDSKETSVATYQIYINKNLVEQEELMNQLKEAEDQYKLKVWIIRILIAVIVIGILLLLIIIHHKKNDKEYKKEIEEKRIYEEYMKERQKAKREREEQEEQHQIKDSQSNRKRKHERKH